MLSLFIAVFLAGLLSLLLAWRVRCQSWLSANQRRQLVTYPALSMSLCLLLLLISACNRTGDTSSSVAPASKSFTPLSIPAATSQTSKDWTSYHNNQTHTGYLPAAPDPHQLTKAWGATLDGAVYAEPLVVGGHVIVATERDTLYSLDPGSGKILWQTHVGTPVAQATLPCGDIDPLGITGTPVYDPETGLLFAVAEIAGPQHVLVGLDVQTGAVRERLSVDVPGMTVIQVYQQRAALQLSQHKVYIAYGGLAGDCGAYRGLVVAAPTNGQGPLLSYQVPVIREGGIWAPSGPTVDTAGNIYVSVGNGETTTGAWDHSDSILRLSPTLKLLDGFAPSEWQTENSQDTDLGSMGPTLLPNGLVFIAGKSGHGYLLHANALGGVGGQISTTAICNGGAFGGTAVMGAQIFVPCTDGLRQVTIGSDLQLHVGWHVNSTLPPIIGGHTIYNLGSNGTLYAYAAATGSIRTQISLGPAATFAHFATPTLSGGHIFVPTMTGLIAVTLS